jgi:hypothetical protein
VKEVEDISFETLYALWDMTEDTIGVHYGQYADMKQTAVVVGTTAGEGRGG